MRNFERSIKIAFDKKSGKIIYADKAFITRKDAFQLRTSYHKGKVELSCCECDQDLVVSDSKNNNIHFKHKPGHKYCILYDNSLVPSDLEKIAKALIAKESERHKELKNKIGTLLKYVPGVNVNTIQIDNKFLVKHNERRRPDVYCKFQDKEIVFEIQLSDLPLSYILSRHDFYKEHGIFLIWILDSFDKNNQGSLERDIKYLTKHENFFKLDEKSDTLKLICDYKIPYLTINNTLQTKWLRKSVRLNDLKFDHEEYQAFYYDFEVNKNNVKAIQGQVSEKLEKKDRIRQEQIKIENAIDKVTIIINDIKEFKNNKNINFDSISLKITELEEYEITIFNEMLNLKERKRPALIQWIDDYNPKENNIAFLEFILKERNIELDVNVNDNGRTAFQALFDNNNILYKNTLILALFAAGYILTESDKILLFNLKENMRISDEEFYIYKLCNDLTNRNLIRYFKNNEISKPLLIIEAISKDKMIIYNYQGEKKWLEFANNAIQYYTEFWKYIELAFKHFRLWDRLIELDTKKSFQNKVKQFYTKRPTQNHNLRRILKDLYPDLICDF